MGATELGPGRLRPAFVTELGPNRVRAVRVRPDRQRPGLKIPTWARADLGPIWLGHRRFWTRVRFLLFRFALGWVVWVGRWFWVGEWVGPRNGGAPEGWSPQGWSREPTKGGAPKGGAPMGAAPKGGGPKISRFFSLSRPHFHYFSLFLWGSSRGILVLFEAPGPSNVHVWSSRAVVSAGGRSRGRAVRRRAVRITQTKPPKRHPTTNWIFTPHKSGRPYTHHTPTHTNTHTNTHTPTHTPTHTHQHTHTPTHQHTHTHEHTPTHTRTHNSDLGCLGLTLA